MNNHEISEKTIKKKKFVDKELLPIYSDNKYTYVPSM